MAWFWPPGRMFNPTAMKERVAQSRPAEPNHQISSVRAQILHFSFSPLAKYFMLSFHFDLLYRKPKSYSFWGLTSKRKKATLTFLISTLSLAVRPKWTANLISRGANVTEKHEADFYDNEGQNRLISITYLIQFHYVQRCTDPCKWASKRLLAGLQCMQM